MGKKILGINGLGRIGKLILWQFSAGREFDEIVVNLGREVGCSLEDLKRYIEKDSTYGSLDAAMFGMMSDRKINYEVDEKNNTITIDGLKIHILTTHRNPRDIDWKGAQIVVDTTGQFNKPNRSKNHPDGSLRGHLEDCRVKKVILSSPFKLEEGDVLPEDATMVVLGVNGHDYDPYKHNIISNASCTTTALAHMLNPLLHCFGAEAISSFSMSTIHATTGKQTVLDCVPKSGESDPCKNRSAMNNICLTTTGAAIALKEILPEMKQTPFTAKSIRIPLMTGSLVDLTVNVGCQKGLIKTAEDLNDLYVKFREDAQVSKYLKIEKKPTVSSDIVGSPFAAVVIAGSETEVITTSMQYESCKQQFKIFGWYDNEFASYVRMLRANILMVAHSIRY